jgi:putative hydrolase of the HAD superfamily
MTPVHFETVLFDWGDTVMKDDPASNVPMVEWNTVEPVQGIQSLLSYLHSSGRRILLATSAAISDESQIRGALGRVDVDKYFDRIYCFKNTGLQKGEEFYKYILNDLGLRASDAAMIGDHYEKDVLAANNLGIFAIWFNSLTEKAHHTLLQVTVHSMEELLSFFRSLDKE